jgi:TonB-dependent receptor
MKPSPSLTRALPFLRAALASLFSFLLVSLAVGQTPTGRITGVVTDSSGNAFLEGAVVTINGNDRATTTDRRGEFDFSALAPGEYSLRIAYTGMTPATTRVTVTAGQSASLTTALTEDVIKMGAFSVVTNRSADALAITDQRNAPNVKNVVDVAAYGMLSNDNPGELLQLLPGVNGTISFGEVDRVSIRGMDANLNAVQLDGNSFATPTINQATEGRSVVLSTTNTNNIKTAEVIKAITPDLPADAIGGIVNLIQKTALDYPKSAGRFEYRLGGQFQTTRSGYDARSTPNAQFTYHDVFGPNRNWGVYATGGFNKEVTNQVRTAQNIVNNATVGYTPISNAITENQRFRHRKNWAATLDHRRGQNHEFAFKYRHEDWLNYNESNVQTFNAMVPAATWTPLVRSYSSAASVVNHNQINPWVRNNALSFDGKHKGDAWEFNYTTFHSSSVADSDPLKDDEFGNANATLLAAFRPSLVVDDTRDRIFNSVRVTSANPVAVYNADYYSLGYTRNLTYIESVRDGFKGNFKYTFKTAVPLTLKTGLGRTEQSRRNYGRTQNITFVGEDGVAGLNAATGRTDDRLSRFLSTGSIRGFDASGNRRPFVLDLRALAKSYKEQPQLWSYDVYTNALNTLTGSYRAAETIDSGYAMGETTWRNLHLLAGVRAEETKVKAAALLLDQPTATAAKIPDPSARAIFNAGRPIIRTGRYDNYFPSLHLNYKIRPNLQARASYSTGISRPGYGFLISATNINDITDTITTSNPNLKPQTADSYDLSLEYFSEPAGVISVGLFRKDIRDYITSTIGTVESGNAFGEQYVGYQLRTAGNAGSAQVQGAEFNIVQQLNFIPRRIGLFTFKGNLTLLRAEGNFGGTTRLSSGEVPDFIPRAWNLVLDYSTGKFSMLARYNYQAAFLTGPNANPNLVTRNPSRVKLDVNLNYRWRRAASFFFAIDNLTLEPIYTQSGAGDRVFAGNGFAPSRRYNLGVQGKF